MRALLFLSCDFFYFFGSKNVIFIYFSLNLAKFYEHFVEIDFKLQPQYRFGFSVLGVCPRWKQRANGI